MLGPRVSGQLDDDEVAPLCGRILALRYYLGWPSLLFLSLFGFCERTSTVGRGPRRQIITLPLPTPNERRA